MRGDEIHRESRISRKNFSGLEQQTIAEVPVPTSPSGRYQPSNIEIFFRQLQ